MSVWIYDAFEINQCIEHDGDIEPIFPPDKPAKNERSFWSVYGHHRKGGLECLADFDNEKSAREFHEYLTELLRLAQIGASMESKRYRVFVRNWWRRDSVNRSRLIPDPGARKTTLARGVTYEEARRLCDEYNSTHEPGVLSRKAEFTSEE